jgi:DtxR family Mn-dependent transcriptional regulator
MNETNFQRLLPALEDSLKAIYFLATERRPASSAAVALQLGITQPSATERFRRLADLSLVSYEPYRGARLTSEGRRFALAVLRRQRLLETFLVEVLGYAWDEVASDADVLEHALSPKLEARIDTYLAHPVFDPHGDPIPALDGTLPLDVTRPLSALEPGCTACLARVGDQTPALLAYLTELRLTPGAFITIIRREPFEGPLMIAVHGRRHVIAADLAATLFVIVDPAAVTETGTTNELVA